MKAVCLTAVMADKMWDTHNMKIANHDFLFNHAIGSRLKSKLTFTPFQERTKLLSYLHPVPLTEWQSLSIKYICSYDCCVSILNSTASQASHDQDSLYSSWYWWSNYAHAHYHPAGHGRHPACDMQRCSALARARAQQTVAMVIIGEKWRTFQRSSIQRTNKNEIWTEE